MSFAEEKLKFSKSAKNLPLPVKTLSKSEAPNKNRKFRKPFLQTARQSLAGKDFDKELFDKKFVVQFPTIAHS